MKQNKEQQELLAELINVFIDIDERIKLLHKDSSDVFLQLNSYLKDYYKKYGIITKNVTQIFDTTTGGSNNSLAEEFNSIYKELKNYKNNTEHENKTNLNLLNQLNGKVNYISVIIRNFKQELTTFIFLITNYKLIANNENYDKSANEIIMKWERLAINSQNSLAQLSREFDKLKSDTDSLYKTCTYFYEDSANQVFGFFEDLKSSSAMISEKEKDSSVLLELLKDKMQNSKESIGNIITHLQYHDIIRQKIEHIQTSHKGIVDSLKRERGIDETATANGDDENTKLALISDISGLQSAQLILISKEYQKALEVITQNFEKIAGDLTSVSNKSNEFSFETENSDTTIIKGVKNKLDKSLLVLDTFNLTRFNKDLTELVSRFDEIYLRASKTVFEPVCNFEKLASRIDRTAVTDKKGENAPTIMHQLESLAGDIVEKKNAMKSELEEIIRFSAEIVGSRESDEIGSFLEKEQIRLMVVISKILERLDEENRMLDELLVQNHNLSKDIISRLEETINYVDYYELFDNVLNEIIQSLNAINNRLIDKRTGHTEFDKINNLKEIEALYTVASERIIHNRIIEGNKDVDIPETQVDEDDDELELF